MDWLWNLFQQKQIAHIQTEVSARQTQRELDSYRVQSVDMQLDRLTLVCQAMWELLRERTGLTESQLLAKVTEVDLRDGKLDGKYKKTKKSREISTTT